jgi:hypothetical protein
LLQVWSGFDPQATQYIPASEMELFLAVHPPPASPLSARSSQKLRAPLGVGTNYGMRDMVGRLESLQLHIIDGEPRIHFTETLYNLARWGDERNEGGEEILLKILAHPCLLAHTLPAQVHLWHSSPGEPTHGRHRNAAGVRPDARPCSSMSL